MRDQGVRARAASVASAILILSFGLIPAASAADHLDSPTVSKHGALDLTGVYGFASNGGSQTVFIVNVNPGAGVLANSGTTFASNVSYQSKVDTDGDIRPDVLYNIKFDPPDMSAALPGYALAIGGQGRVALARGDLYARSGDQPAADEQYATVDFNAGLGRAPGRVYDREYATFLADHGRDTATAVKLTAAELEQRKDIYGYDAYAWALHADEQHARALAASRSALALGTRDPRLLYHAGMIELANGLTAEGRAHLEAALAMHPVFNPMAVAQITEALAR